MSYETLRYEVKDAIATLTLDRPDAYNALNLTLGRELFHATLEADEDRAVRCIVITGAGKAFCAGGDVKDFAEAGDRVGIVIKELTTYLHGAVSRLARSPKPVIMGINGIAAGGGMSFALSGDLVVATESAKFTMAVLPHRRLAGRLGLLLPAPAHRAPAGARAALHQPSSVSTRGAGLGTDQPRAPRRRVRRRPRRPRARARGGPTAAYGRAKALFHQSTHESLETQMELEAQAIAASGHTEDFRAGVRAFAAKQPVSFRGR